MPDAKLYEDDFVLGKPALVCRWRLAGGRLPMANRHLRALGARHVGSGRVPKELVAWAKQHIEWTLEDGATSNPDGVLMLIVDEAGKAAMSVGPYEPLEDPRLSVLCGRASLARREAGETGVAPETLWLARGGELLREATPGEVPSGASSLVSDLAKTLGIPVRHVEGLLESVQANKAEFDEAFLVSDEYGIVPASDSAGAEGRRFADGYATLLERTRKKAQGPEGQTGQGVVRS